LRVIGWFDLPDPPTLSLGRIINELSRRPRLEAAKSDGSVEGSQFASSIPAYPGVKGQEVAIQTLITV
jgi:sorbitol-specific phosphotransferase system component IIC